MTFKLAHLHNPSDTVAVALEDLNPGDSLKLRSADGEVMVSIKEPIQFGHKFAVTTVAVGDKVIKYGEIIGEANRAIEAGAHVHTHNLKSLRYQ